MKAQAHSIVSKTARDQDEVVKLLSKVSPSLTRLYRMVDNRRSIEEIAAKYAALGDVEQMLDRLESLGFVEYQSAQKEQSPAASVKATPDPVGLWLASSNGSSQRSGPRELPQVAYPDLSRSQPRPASVPLMAYQTSVATAVTLDSAYDVQPLPHPAPQTQPPQHDLLDERKARVRNCLLPLLGEDMAVVYEKLDAVASAEALKSLVDGCEVILSNIGGYRAVNRFRAQMDAFV